MPRAVTPGPEQGALGCRTRRPRPCRAGRADAEEAGVRARAAGAEPCARRSWSVLPPARHPSLVHPSICLRVHHPSVCPSIHPPVIYPPTCLPPMHTPQCHPPICPFVCPPVRPSVRVPTRPSPLPSVLPSTGPPDVCRATSVHRGCTAEQGDGAPGGAGAGAAGWCARARGGAPCSAAAPKTVGPLHGRGRTWLRAGDPGRGAWARRGRLAVGGWAELGPTPQTHSFLGPATASPPLLGGPGQGTSRPQGPPWPEAGGGAGRDGSVRRGSSGVFCFC